MKKVIYYRKNLMSKEELTSAQKYFECVDLISNIPKNSFVIPRYSMYPFPFDNQREFTNLNCTAINSHRQHTYIADLLNYYLDLKDYTPKTWSDISQIDEDGPYVLKGETNSKKMNWNKFCFAKDKGHAIKIYCDLLDDLLIGQQKIYIRKFIPLKTYLVGIGGMPITKEFRIFIANRKVISIGYYWANYLDDLKDINTDDVPIDFIDKIIDIVGDKSNFYAIDIAQTELGNWIVIELNCGMQSGLVGNDPDKFYCNLFEVLK